MDIVISIGGKADVCRDAVLFQKSCKAAFKRTFEENREGEGWFDD